ncbi:hypothetical protein UA08_05746 [Talaromyces atroroseus]|uniref:CHL4 family chromosome segregation protein n=1 Tax=Talaromyces atroroseus TaxID=1441469 RepID=A0A225ACG4_TALAT|nr:hypothetical protein UA08_05746 [Talaromyces atroroseus]OKL58821.1 hypothetical protein UA08_05746 [Talaromyces atroroseus]
MVKKKITRAPTTSSLPNNLRVPSNTTSLVRALGKLSRQSLLDLVFTWLSKNNVQLYPPFLARDLSNIASDHEESPYPAAESVEEVRGAYEELRQRKGGKREVVDRVLEGDWRHGITLGQLAMIDIRYLEDHPAAQKWTAFRLALTDRKQQSEENEESSTDLSASLPRLHAAMFLSNLHREISPLVKAHYHLARSKSLPLTFLRIFTTDSPYQHPQHGAGTYLDSARILYIAFPDSSPFIYTSLSASTGTKPGPATQTAAPLATDTRTLRAIVRDALPTALSKQHERYKLEATSLTAKNLDTMLALRGPGRTNMANGAFSIFADAVIEGTPIDPRQPATVSPEDFRATGTTNDDKENNSTSQYSAGQEDPKRKNRSHTHDDHSGRMATSPATKRRKVAVLSRFGTSGTPASLAVLNRLDIRLQDHLDDIHDKDLDNDDQDQHIQENSEYTMSLSFTGNNVIAGFRQLAELGVVDPERMPSWMTGEEGVSSAVIRRGRRPGTVATE